MRVAESKVSHPINAMGGYYVLIEGTREEIYGGAADRLAMRTADLHGWKGEGRGSVDIPTRQGVALYSRAYWFYEKR